MDRDEALDYADQFPLPDRDMEEDNQILATLLKQIPSCVNEADIEQLLQEISVLYSGRPKARCYPFNLAGHRFRGKNRQVQVFHVI